MNLDDFNTIEGELIQMGYNSLEISSIWNDKPLLKQIISRIEEAKSLSMDELEAKLIASGGMKKPRPHDCWDHPSPYEHYTDGQRFHGTECAICGELLCAS